MKSWDTETVQPMPRHVVTPFGTVFWPLRCIRCNGTGQVARRLFGFLGWIRLSPCLRCEGEGHVWLHREPRGLRH